MSKYITPDARAKRAKQRRAKRLVMFACAAIFILTASWGIVKVVETFSTKQPDPDLLAPDAQAPNTSLESQGDWDTFTGPIQQTINFEIISPEPTMIQVTQNGRVELSYFDDAVFVGDSLADGFRVYKGTTGLTNSKFITAKGLSPRSFLVGGFINITADDNKTIETVHGFETIAAANPKKVYITLGTNALMNQSNEDLLADYHTFIDTLRTYVPQALIYVTSIPPTAAFKSAAEPRLEINRIYEVNRQIAKMCNEKGLAFINLYEVLKSGSGYLREDISYSDGIHLTPTGYVEWADYLITHTVYAPDSPYVPGSPYYME